uniref:Uncharacterized protein n=1 Tax=Oryza glumipatula TaxID=40148 RepID=A0A0D9YUS5_9ORYZ
MHLNYRPRSWMAPPGREPCPLSSALRASTSYSTEKFLAMSPTTGATNSCRRGSPSSPNPCPDGSLWNDSRSLASPPATLHDTLCANMASSLSYSVVQLANEKQLIDHYGSKHPKEKPPSPSE